MLKTNSDKLIKSAVVGEITHPLSGRRSPYRISAEGEPKVLPGVGGITYNLRVGDSATEWEADHVEPGVSISNFSKKGNHQEAVNAGLNLLACVGNKATVISGEAEGEEGTVTGKHGGIEHVLVDFEPEVLAKLRIGDKMQVKAFGLGLKLLDYPDVKIMNISPELLNRWEIKQKKDRLEVPVTHKVPASVMGSGLGADNTYTGDYDIQLFDEATVEEYGLDDLSLGDIVAIMDADHSFGRIFKSGSISVGIIVHTRCISSGHGPGVTTLMTSSKGKIEPVIDEKANISSLLDLR